MLMNNNPYYTSAINQFSTDIQNHIMAKDITKEQRHTILIFILRNISEFLSTYNFVNPKDASIVTSVDAPGMDPMRFTFNYDGCLRHVKTVELSTPYENDVTVSTQFTKADRELVQNFLDRL